ncbi:hypothetical protein [Mesorhizobium amorphae]|uniref:hypothetical protein n=1 Tax=Mesorhizobium amorphae TaxID=71433 RepID=UPI001185771A|nr:hypothetical protein [Mesorhizobium amorphae]
MSTINDGGPAFPSVLYSHERAESWSTDGMTLRDWFASHATEQDIEHHRELTIGDDGYPYWKRSREAARYAFADEMLAERAKGGEA